MALDQAAFADAMKTLYLPPLNEQFYRSHVLLDRVQKNSEDVSGNFAYVPLVTGRNRGVGSRKDGSSGPALPPAGNQSYDSATFKMALHYGRGSVTGPVMRASKSSAGAFAKALDVEMQGLMDSLPEDLNRQVWGYGHGRLATLAAGTTAGSTQATSLDIEVNSHASFGARVGHRVHFGDITAGPTTTVTPATGTTISSIQYDQDADGNASTFKHTVTLAAASGATLTNSVSAMYMGAGETIINEKSSYAQEMYGIQALIDDGAIGADEGLGSGIAVPGEAAEFLDGSLSLGSINRASVTVWRAQVMQNPDGAGTNRPMTIELWNRAFLKAVMVGGAKPMDIEIYTNPGLWSTFGLLHMGDRRYNDYQETIEGGWLAMKFNGRPVLMDIDAPRDVVWFIDMKNIMFLTQSGYELMDDDGSVLKRVPDRDAYEFTLYRDCQMGAKKLNSSVKLDDCQVVANIDPTN